LDNWFRNGNLKAFFSLILVLTISIVNLLENDNFGDGFL
jgi:hypothetical protein